MVDAQPVQVAVGDLLQQQPVAVRINRRLLDAQTGERGDVEEPPVVELLAGHPPVAEPVMLPRQRGEQVAVDPGAGGERHLVVVVADPVVVQHELVEALRQRFAEDRHQDLARVVGGVPLDVEPRRVRRRRPLPQHRPPGGVARFRLRDRGVVGDDVQNQPEAGVAAGRAQPPETGLPAELVVQPAVVDHVVAVHRARRGLQDRASSRGG